MENGNGLDPKINNAIQNIVKKERFVSNKIFTRLVSSEGGSYLGELYTVDINGETPEGEKEINIFVKRLVPVAAESLKECFDLYELYSRETFFYTDLMNVFEEIQGEANVPIGDRFKAVKGYEECTKHALILENLAKQGYTTGYRMDVVSFKFAKLAMEQLARFHSLSIVTEKLKPTYFNEKIKNLKILTSWEGESRKTIENVMRNTAKQIKNEDYRQRVEDMFPTIIDTYIKYFSLDNTPILTLSHSDYRPNNILVKQIDGEIEDLIPIDYQLMYYGCPINDILYFIYLGTDREFRIKYLEELKNVYYNSMIRFLKYFDIDFEKILTRKEFKKLFEDRKAYGLCAGLNIYSFIFTKEDDIIEFGKDDLEKWVPELDERFQIRINEIIEDYFNL